MLPPSGQEPHPTSRGGAALTRILKKSWMEFLFSSFLGPLGASSPVWAAVTAALASAGVSEILAAGFGSSLGFTAGAGSAAAGGAGLAFGSAAWQVGT